MAICYNKLWKMLIDKGMTKTDLKNTAGINSATLANLGKNKYISLRTLDKICIVLECDFGDIIEHLKNNSDTKKENDQ